MRCLIILIGIGTSLLCSAQTRADSKVKPLTVQDVFNLQLATDPQFRRTASALFT